MKLVVHVVGQGTDPFDWPEGWPPPRVGDEIEIPDNPSTLFVRTVVWYPQGESGVFEWSGQPFVYLVLGETP